MSENDGIKFYLIPTIDFGERTQVSGREEVSRSKLVTVNAQKALKDVVPCVMQLPAVCGAAL